MVGALVLILMVQLRWWLMYGVPVTRQGTNNLSRLKGGDGFVINSIDERDRSGNSVNGADDVSMAMAK